MTDNKSDIIKRLVDFRNETGLMSKDFAIKAGIDPRNYSSIENGNRPFGPRVMQDICRAFGLNIKWLKTGTGEKYLTGEGEMLKTEENNDTGDSVEFVRLLPVSAQGGSLNDFIIAVKDSDCEQIISPVRGADFAMSVAGDSMTPEYPSGAQILIKKINAQAFIDWGKVYVLDTCNGSIIKRIFPADDPDKVKCVSINSEYPPFEVSLEDVFGVYRVLLCMAVK